MTDSDTHSDDESMLRIIPDSEYPRGTLLDAEGDPVLNADGNRILVGRGENATATVELESGTLVQWANPNASIRDDSGDYLNLPTGTYALAQNFVGATCETDRPTLMDIATALSDGAVQSAGHCAEFKSVEADESPLSVTDESVETLTLTDINRRSDRVRPAAIPDDEMQTDGGGGTGSEYKRLVIGAGEKKLIQISSGQTLSNTLFDISASGADVRMVTSGSGWTIQNVGIRGKWPAGSHGGFANRLAANGSGTVRRVYFGDGVAQQPSRGGAIGVTRGNSGTVRFIECLIQGCSDNGLYAAGTAVGGGAKQYVERCLFRNNNISHIRIAQNGSRVTDCVIYNTGNVPTVNTCNCVNSRGIYDGYGDRSDTVTVTGTHIDVTASNTNGGNSALVAAKTTFNVSNSQLKGQVIGEVKTSSTGTNPSTTPPTGVPMSPTAAASGTGGTDGGDGGTPDPGEDDGDGGTGGGGGTPTPGEGGGGGQTPVRGPSVPDPQEEPFAVHQSLDFVGDEGRDLTIAGIDVPGIYSISESGAGKESSYVTEIQAGGWSAPGGGETGSGSGSQKAVAGSDVPTASEDPPVSLSINAVVGLETFEALKELRVSTDVFDVEFGPVALSGCELSNLERTLVGDSPHTYDVSIEVQEYRIAEVETQAPPTTGGGSSGGGGGGGGGGGLTGGWVDNNNDGIDDITGEKIPPFKRINVRGTHRVNIGAGQTFGNVLFDASPRSAQVMIRAAGNGWNIKNVGVKGIDPGAPRMLVPGVPSMNASASIQKLYMGDGQVPRSANGCVWVNANMPHRGVINWKNVHIAGHVDNGLYGSGPTSKGHPGIINVYDSYFEANNIANIRGGARNGRSSWEVRNCTVKQGNTPPCGAGCSSPGAVNPRGIWSHYGVCHAYDCDVATSQPTPGAHGGRVVKHNTRTGSAANGNRVPEGVPRSAEDAAGSR